MNEKDKTLCVDYSAQFDSNDREIEVLHILTRAYSQWIAVSCDVSISFIPKVKIAHLLVHGISTDIVVLVVEALDLKPVVRRISEAEVNA